MKKKFFLFRWLDALFNKVKKLAIKFVTPSVEIVEAIDRAVNSSVTPLITALIPGHWDDIIVAKVKTALPQVLKVLKISEECLKLEAADEIIACAIKNLKTYDKDGRAANYHNIAALLSVYISDHKITWREAVHLAEEIYQKRKAGEMVE